LERGIPEDYPESGEDEDELTRRVQRKNGGLKKA
jgi:hypothetical protein